MKKIAGVSLLTVCIACSAMAENFPNDGYMLENKTYDNAATYENMGVYSGSVDAIADYNDCPENSYCDELGQHQCPGGYPYSAAGAGASTECYKACTTANVPHSYAVTGNDYNGGTDTCAATSCVRGYQVGSGFNLASIIGNDNGENLNATSYTEFYVDYGSRGVITGRAICADGYSTIENDLPTDEISYDNHCYCQLNEYTPVSGSVRSVSTPWVYLDYYGEQCFYLCVDMCAEALYYNREYRSTILNLVPTGLATCEPNTITINWSDVDGEDNPFATNVTYDGDIATPVKAATYPGKTFIGWRFVRPDDEYGS